MRGGGGGGGSQKCVYQKWLDQIFPIVNSIAFGSAPRREVDSQPIRQLDRPAVSQTETHTLGFLRFLSVADTAISSRERSACHDWHRPNSNASGCRQFVRRFEPRCWQYQCLVCSPGFEPPRYKSATECFTIRPAVVCEPPVSPLLGAFSAKTFDPPPLKKVLSSFRG